VLTITSVSDVSAWAARVALDNFSCKVHPLATAIKLRK